MKYILITLMLNSPITYDNEAICNLALVEVKKQDETAICIPAGETQQETMVLNFFKMFEKLQSFEIELENKETAIKN